MHQNPSFLIVFLSTDNEFIASVQGKMEEGEKGDLNWVQVSSSFQGKGFCTQIVKFAFDLLKKHRISQVEIHNLADLIGSRCYKKQDEKLDTHSSVNLPPKRRVKIFVGGTLLPVMKGTYIDFEIIS